MKPMGVAEVKARLSEVLRRVRAGQEVVVSERGRPVAKLVPLAGRPGEDDETLDLVKRGVLRRGRGPLPKRFWNTAPEAKDPDGSVLRALLEEREDER